MTSTIDRPVRPVIPADSRHNAYIIGYRRPGRADRRCELPEAAAAYAAEEAAHRLEENLEIVLVGADSIETIMRTHGHYFEPIDSPFEDLVASGR